MVLALLLVLPIGDRVVTFVFSPSHAQVYDKNNLTGGTVEEFGSFIKEKTQKEIVFIR